METQSLQVTNSMCPLAEFLWPSHHWPAHELIGCE